MTENLKELAAEVKRRGIPPRYFAAQLRRGVPAEDIIAAWPVQTHLDRIGSRRSRRLLVIATYGGWLLVALLSKPVSSPKLHFPVLGFVLLANAFATVILLHRRSFLNRSVLAGD